MTGHILLVDDEYDFLSIVQAILEDAGFVVRTAHDGRAAVEAARLEQPDLVVMDLMMPHLDGIAAARKMREIEGWSSPILLTSAVRPPKSQYENLVQGFLKKPFDLDLLLDSVQSLIGPGAPVGSARASA